MNEQQPIQQGQMNSPHNPVELIEFWSEPAVRDLDESMKEITRDLTIGNLDKSGVIYVNNCLSLCEDITEMAKRALRLAPEKDFLYAPMKDENGKMVSVPYSTRGAEALKDLRTKIYKATITYTQVNRSRDGFERRQQTTQRQETSFRDTTIQKKGIFDNVFPKKQQQQ
jgi:hypothetical protein